jgi:tetratricopeptide (TPR) repeat protein
MSSRQWIVALWIASWQLAGCTAAPTINVEEWYSGPAKQAFAEKHEKLARGYEFSGSLRLALQEWFAISAVFPDASEPQTQIERLQQMIASRIEKHQRLAQLALVKSDYANAQLQLLKVLALKPDDQDAVKALKSLVTKVGYARLASAPKVSDKVTQAYQAPATSSNDKVVPEIIELEQSSGLMSDAQANSHPPADDSGGESNLELGLRYLSDKQYEAALARFLLARKLKQVPEGVLNKHIVYTRNVLAEQHYDNGVSAFRMASYDLAVSEFKKALEYNPQHQKARLYLGSASEMQTRLAPSP